MKYSVYYIYISLKLDDSLHFSLVSDFALVSKYLNHASSLFLSMGFSLLKNLFYLLIVTTVNYATHGISSF